MNCKRIEELIPLYAGGDIDSRLTAEVQSHLQRCDGCSGSATEYETSRAWLNAATPELDEALLADVKRGVMRELREPGSRPGLFESISAALARVVLRPAVAVALLMAVFGAVTFWIYLARPAAPESIQLTEDEPARVTPVPNGIDTPGRVAPPLRRRQDDHWRKPVIARSHKEERTGAESRQASTGNSDVAVDAQTPSALAVESSGMLRIDIQTGDPNIRIIWFAPKEVDGPQTNP